MFAAFTRVTVEVERGNYKYPDHPRLELRAYNAERELLRVHYHPDQAGSLYGLMPRVPLTYLNLLQHRFFDRFYLQKLDDLLMLEETWLNHLCPAELRYPEPEYPTLSL